MSLPGGFDGYRKSMIQTAPVIARIHRVLALSMTMFGFVIASPASAQPPNIIVIYTDDQGFGDAGCLNPGAKFSTPHLDRLAAEGMSFTNAHSSDSVCTPSRYGLLTGRYSWRTTLKTGVMGAEGTCLIADDRTTLASLLRDRGYDTAMVGKWHLGMDFPGDSPANRDWTQPVRDMPLDKGFDYFFGIPASLNYGVLAWFEGRHAKVPPTLFTNKKPNQRHVDYRIMPPYQDSPQQTKAVVGTMGMEVAPDFIDNQCLTRFTDKAIEWIGTKKGSTKPFFVYLPYTSPHYPVCPLPEFHGQGECGGYGEFMIETDHHVGRILDFLKQAGIDDNTMIVYTSDNGPENSWKQRIDDFGHHSNAIYRGGKRDIYEGGHRVPFFVRWPNGIKSPGRESEALIGQIDLLATFAEILGEPLPDTAGEDSHSFASLLTDPDHRHIRRPLINHGVSGRFSITDGDWKLIMAHQKQGTELYNLRSDPGEQTDLIAEQDQTLIDNLTQSITDIICNGRTTPGARQNNDTDHWKDLTWITAETYRARQK